MDLHGTLRYRGKKIYLNRKRLLENGDWKWIQDSTGVDRGDEETATKLLAERNASELAKHELRALVARSNGSSPSGDTLRSFSRQWVETRKTRELTSAFDDECRFAKHVWPFIVDGVGELGGLLLQQVRPRHIRALVMSLANKLASRSVRNIYSMVHAMFDDAYADELVESNPCRLRRGDIPVSEDKDPRWRSTAVFAREELIALISDPRIPIDRRTLYATAFFGACRSGELSALRVGDYDRSAHPLFAADHLSVVLRQAEKTESDQDARCATGAGASDAPALARRVAGTRLRRDFRPRTPSGRLDVPKTSPRPTLVRLLGAPST
jgi:hypothetical protein